MRLSKLAEQMIIERDEEIKRLNREKDNLEKKIRILEKNQSALMTACLESVKNEHSYNR